MSPLKGKPRSAETRARISQSKLGHKRSEETKRKLSAIHKEWCEDPTYVAKLSHPHSPETKQLLSKQAKARWKTTEYRDRIKEWSTRSISSRIKMSIAKKGDKSFYVVGDNRYYPVRGGSHRTWAKAVKIRDNYTCRLCNSALQSNKLHAHHIKTYLDYPDLRDDVNNGITVCIPCHHKIHNNMLTPKDLIKMAMNEITAELPEQKKSPTREAIETGIDAGKAVLGGGVAAINGIASLQKKAPERTIQ